MTDIEMRNAEFELTQLQKKMMLTEKGELFYIRHVEIVEEESEMREVKKNFLSSKMIEKKFITKKHHISKVEAVYAEHIGTTWHSYWEFGEKDSISFEHFLRSMRRARERYMTMKEKLDLFGYKIIPKDDTGGGSIDASLPEDGLSEATVGESNK